MGAATAIDESGVVGHVKVGGLEFEIFNSQIQTITNQTGSALASRKLYVKAYQELTGDKRPEVDYRLARQVVLSFLQLEWYSFHRIVASERVMVQHRQTLALARISVMRDETETPATPTATAETFKSAKEVCRHALANGWSEETTIEKMTELFPVAKVPHKRTYTWCKHRHAKGEKY